MAEGSKTPKVELTVSVDGVAIQEPKSKKIQHQYPLNRISYCADDKAEKRFFSFIAKESDSDKHTCFVFVSGKTAESETEKIARLERETGELRQRLRDLASLAGENKVAEYMKKNNIKELCLVGGEGVEAGQPESPVELQNNISAVLDVSEVSDDSAVDTKSDADKLISFDAPATKLDQMTLDDLNDDDFDPRAEENPGDSSDTSDDFNPRSGSLSATPLSVKPVSAASPPSSAPPTRILPPPSLPPRDPTKLPAPAAA